MSRRQHQFEGRRAGDATMTIVISSNRLEKKRREAIRSRTVVDRHRYFEGVAQARFVLRKVFRLVEEQAKLAGLDPLEHQGLIQIYGSPTKRLRVKEVAERLDIAPAFASGLVKSLERRGYVTRVRSEDDQRVVFSAITAKGMNTLHGIDEQVQIHVEYFAQQLDRNTREAVISIVMFYVGISLAAPSAANA
jgi:DNA-binding MarR family transcriptional regulator